MGESQATYEHADLVAELTDAVRRRQPELLQLAVTALRPLHQAITVRELSWRADESDVDARFAAVFLDLLFTHLGAGGFDEPSSALGCRLRHHSTGSRVVTAHPAGPPTLTGTASDLITAAWFDLCGIDYMATTFVLRRDADRRCLRMHIGGGSGGLHRAIATASVAAHSSWAYTIATGTRDPDREQPGTPQGDPRLARLPIDTRTGLPIPFTASVEPGGRINFSKLDPAKMRRVIDGALCGICGQRQGGIKAFIGGFHAATMGVFLDPPMHRSCAQAALTSLCPHMLLGGKVGNATAVQGRTRPEGWYLYTTRSYTLVWARSASDRQPTTRAFRASPPLELHRYHYVDGRLTYDRPLAQSDLPTSHQAGDHR